MDFDWKRPFEIAFEFGLWTLGWVLVSVIGLFALAAAVGLAKALVGILKGKKKLSAPTSKTKNSFRLVKGDGKKE
jgi:hypothetical protein